MLLTRPNKIDGELTPIDTDRSTLVLMVIPDELAAVTAPMVKPVNVTATEVPAAIAAFAVVMTICVLVGVDTVPVDKPSLKTTLGTPELEKKPNG